jgi:hypothetical protein
MAKRKDKTPPAPPPDLHVVEPPQFSQDGQKRPGGEAADGEQDDGLDPRETAFVTALLDGCSVEEAGKVVGIAPRSARRWRHRPAVVTALREASRASVAQATAVLAAGATKAATALIGIANGTIKAGAPRVQAARACLEFASKGTDLQEIEEQIRELKAQLSGPSAPFTTTGKGF